MKSKIKKLNGTAREFHIALSSDTVTKVFHEVIDEMKKEATFPGFRKGRAPEDLIIKKHKEDAMDEVKKRLVPWAYQKVLDEHSVLPVGYPELSDISIDGNGELSFRAVVDSHPEVKLQNYKGYKLKSAKITVNDDELNGALEHIRNMMAEFVDVEGEVKKGFSCVCDIETFIGEKPISKKRENAWVEADKDVSMLGVGEHLVGLKKGDEKEIDVVLPENYPDKNFAGKKVLLRVKINEVKEKKLPELNAEMAKKMGKEDLEILKRDLKDQLLQKKESDSKNGMKRQIIDILLKKHSFNLPESMVNRQLNVLVGRAEQQLKEKGLNDEEIKKKKNDLNKQLSAEARNKVKLYFILDAISKKEGINVAEDEIEDRIKDLAAYYNQPFEQVKKYYNENNLIGGVAEQIREEKTFDLILREAVVSVK